ncbi:MAG: precorrin-6y C5,15-methyltransferase (decarboxylating) subunit CbiE [Sneathiella sp.]|nr:precorrin-6y C5,15-methyltransferase (decarboxylating) subunit CbiE [Sneathiella sp.]
MSPWLHIIGVGDDGLGNLSADAKTALEKSEVIIGGDRHLAMLPAEDKRPKISWPSPLLKLVEEVKDRRGQQIVVLATGDPMHYGIGVTFSKHLPAEEMAIYPSFSAFSLAAARLCWDLAKTHQMTLHGRPLDLIRPYLYDGAQILALSDSGHTPNHVAKLLQESGFGHSRLTVLEHMGGPTERRMDIPVEKWRDQDFKDLNTLAITCKSDDTAPMYSHIPGLPDEAFIHDGQLTKSEIRSTTLSALSPFPGMLLWDVGAGCGSVGIEWMRCHPRNNAIAIEKHPARLEMIEQNKARLGTPLLKVISGAAPSNLEGLPVPDRVFIGGGLTKDVFGPCYHALKSGGVLVANTVTIEGERLAFDLAETYGGQLRRLNFARAQKIGGFTSWKPFRQVTQLSIKKS